MAMKRERRRLCKFLSDWTLYDEFSSWLIPVKGDNHKAHCILCKKVFAVSHGGLNDVKAHYKGKRHIWLQRQQQETAEDSSNLWEGHQNFRSKNVGQNIVFNEKTDAIEEVANISSQSPSSVGEETVGEDSSENGDKYWEFDLGPESPSLVAGRIPESTPSKKMNSQLKMMPQQYCLRWKYHHNNLQAMFSQLLERESYCDVTIACEGKTIRAHKIVLSACSTYFDAIFSQHEEKNPIVILKDVKFSDIKALVEFMYKGEINVDNSHLTSLLKTAEDLHIKGLAEVSWRSDRSGGPASDESEPSYSHAATPDASEPPSKRRRPRTQPPPPPADEDNFNPMVMSVTGAAGTENAFTVREDMIQNNDEDMDETVLDDSEPEVISDDGDEEDAADYQPTNPFPVAEPAEPEPQEPTPAPTSEESILQRISAQYPDVVKLNDYLTTGRRQQFWEEPFTRHVMEAIKGKELEMKIGAELLGVSYGTLYGRYRDAYGCLKHPYRVRDFWSESGPADILAKVQRKEITLFHAAEMLNVTVTTLANYLSTLRQPGSASQGKPAPPANDEDDEEDDSMAGDDEEDEDDEQQSQLPVTIKLEMTNHEHRAEEATQLGGNTNNNKDRSDAKSEHGETNGTDNEVTGSPR